MAHCVLRHARYLARALVLATTLMVVVSGVRADITEEGGNTVFRSGGVGGPLFTRSWSFTVPRKELHPRLVCEFGFSTDETLLPQAFPDSFTITVQSASLSVTAVLLTADRSGVAWAPPSPGTLAVDPASMQHLPASFPALQPALDSREAYLADFSLPDELVGRDVVVFGDFFDNANGVHSLAYATQPQVHSLPDGGLTNVVLESSASVGGPFAVESEAVLDVETRTFRLPIQSGRRFFQLDSDLRLRLAPPRVAGGEVSLLYAVHPADLVVEEATAVTGPFAPAQVVGFEVSEQAVVLVRPSGQRFYRVRSTTPLRLVTLKPEGNQLMLLFAVTPSRLRVLSSTQAGGPYAVESGVAWDPTIRRVSLPQSGGARFFRVRGNAACRITRLGIRGERWEVTYDGP